MSEFDIVREAEKVAARAWEKTKPYDVVKEAEKVLKEVQNPNSLTKWDNRDSISKPVKKPKQRVQHGENTAI